MPRQIIKSAPGEDFYVEWSSIVEAPTFWGTRVEMAEFLAEPKYEGVDGDARIAGAVSVEKRLARADEHGTSAYPPFGCTWDDPGQIYMQIGVLPRTRLRELCEVLATLTNEQWTSHPDSVRALLDPFEDGV